MQALTFKRYGKSPDIGLADVPRPTPKADELLVHVHAAGLNPIDNMIPTGMFKPVLHFQLPATLGSDLAGIVTEVGSNVTASSQAMLSSPASSILAQGRLRNSRLCRKAPPR